MKFPPKKLEAIINSLPENIRGILLYGSDSGAVNDKFMRIKQNFLGKNQSELSIIKFEYSLIKEQTFHLKEEINNLNSGVLKKIILIYNSLPSLHQELKIILKNVPYGVLIIFLTEDLGLSSSLRKFFEEEEHLIAIPNYIDEVESLKKIAIEFLQEKFYTFDFDFIDFFCHSVRGDRAIFRNELEKIILYQGENKHITLNNVLKIIPNFYEENLENSWLDLILQKHLLFESKFENLISETLPVSIIRSFSNLIMRLCELKILLNKGCKFQEASKKLSPPIFFKNLSKFEIAVTKFTIKQLILILQQLQQLEKEAKVSDIAFSNKILSFFLEHLK